VRVVDEAVLAVLNALPFDIHEADVITDTEQSETQVVVTYDLPYAVYYSNVGDDHEPRLDGRTSRRSVFISLMFVGVDHNQAKWAGEKIREALEGKRIPVPGHKSFLMDLQESQRVRRDDDAIRPDGSPLFYGVDNYAMSITRVRQEAVA
jgi:hypothetical protein